MREAPAVARPPFDEAAYLAALQTLGVLPPADRNAIHRAYREGVKRVHPDLFPDGDEKARATRRIQEMNAARAYALHHWHGFELVRRWSDGRPPARALQAIPWHEWLMLPVTSVYAFTTFAAAAPVLALARLTGRDRGDGRAGAFVWRLWLLAAPHVATLALFARVDPLAVKAWFGVSFLIMFSADVATLVTGDPHTLRGRLGAALDRLG